MMPRSRWSIVLTLLFALGQLALPAALTIGDAHASAHGRAVVGHIEGGSGSGCRAPHPSDCAVCQFITALAAPAPTVVAQFVPQGESDRTAFASSEAPASTWHDFLSRAPPAVTA